jgi:membrane protease YdiL (CAAX protease family)
VIERVRREPAATGAWFVAAGGCIVLAARPFVGVGANARLMLFALAYAVVASASIALPAMRHASQVSAPIVLAIGLACIGTAAMAAGAPVPVPWAAAALPMSLIAAVAEEALFRRVLYGRLARFGAIAAIVGSAALFAAVHVPAYGVAAIPVDVGAGLLFGWQRWASGSWLVPAATHAAANALVVLG